MKKKKIKLISISVASVAVVATAIPIILTSCAQSTQGQVFNNNQKPSNQISDNIQNPNITQPDSNAKPQPESQPQPEQPVKPVEPPKPTQPQPPQQQLIKEPTGTVLVNDESYANMISQQLPEMQILIPNDLDISSLTQQQLQEYVNERVKLNLDSAISSVNEWNKERGYDSQNISVDKIKFEKDNSNTSLYSFNNNTNTPEQNEVNVAIQYGDSNPVATNITLKKSNSISGTDHATNNEVLARINKYFESTDLNGYDMNRNIDKEPNMLKNDDVDAFIKSRLDLNSVISLAQQDIINDQLDNIIELSKLKFEFTSEGVPGQVRVWAKYDSSSKVRTTMTISNIYSNEQQIVNNIKLPKAPAPLKTVKIPENSIYNRGWWMDATNCGAVDGMYAPEVYLSLGNNPEESLVSQYSFNERAISNSFYGYKNPNFIHYKPNINEPGFLEVTGKNDVHTYSTGMQLVDNPFSRTRIFASKDQFTTDTDTITVSADIRTTNPEVYADKWQYRDLIKVDPKQNQYFWWDTTENKIVSNDLSFSINKHDIRTTHKYKLIITSKGIRRTSKVDNFYDWQNISYVSPESIYVRPFDPNQPNGSKQFQYLQDFSTNSYLQVNNGGYLNGDKPTVIKLNAINFGQNYKVSWYRDNSPINNMTNLDINRDSSLEYTASIPGSYTIKIFDQSNTLLHTSKPVQIKENILKDSARISIANKKSDGFEKWNDLFKLQANQTMFKTPDDYVYVPGSFKVSIFDTVSNETFADELTSKDLYALKYTQDLNLKIKSKVSFYDKTNKKYVDINYIQPDSDAVHINAFNGEFDLNKPTNPTQQDIEYINCFRWAVKKSWSVGDDAELRDMDIRNVNDRQLNGYYHLKKKLYEWLVHFYPELEAKVKPANLVFKIIDRDIIKGVLKIILGYASDGVNFAWSDLPVLIKGFDNDSDQAIANAIAEHNQEPIPFGGLVPISILEAGYGAVNIQTVRLNLTAPELKSVKKYNISLFTKYEDRRKGYDNWWTNFKATNFKRYGEIKVYVKYNGCVADKPITVWGFMPKMMRDYYYTAKENADYFAEINKNNANLTVVRDIFPSNITSNELSIDDVLVDDYSMSAYPESCPGFYTERLSRRYFSFATTKEWRDEAMKTGNLKVRVKFTSPIDYKSALSDTILTIKGFRTYLLKHDNNQVYTDKQIVDMLYKWNDPGFRRGIIINDPKFNDFLYSYNGWRTVDDFKTYLDNNSWLMLGLIVNKLPQYINRDNIVYKLNQLTLHKSQEWGPNEEYSISFNIGYKSPHNQITMYSDETITLIFRNDPKYKTFDLACHGGFGEDFTEENIGY